jgi:pimeloyl-ACP methyl ester carboxylesterase
MANSVADPATGYQNLSETHGAPRRGKLWRYTRRILLSLLVLVLALAACGFIYQAIETALDARRFPQEGKSVALGGALGNLSLNLNCSGQGSPAVILDSGLGVPAAGWKFSQTEIAKFTRVCSYDRAGYGWSGAASPGPRTSLEIARELHALLAAAEEKAPYILVGHSFGGFNVRVYTNQFPSEVVGVVLVDTSHEDQEKRMPPVLQASFKKQMQQIEWQQKLAPLLIHSGFARLTGGSDGAYLPRDFQRELQYLELQTKFIDAAMSESAHFSESAEQVRAAGNLGDRPLIVLTAGKNPDASVLPKEIPAAEFAAFHQIWIDELQPAQARLSTRGKRIIIPDSDHMIPFHRPDAVTSAVREVWAAVNPVAGGTPIADQSGSKP